MLGHSHDYPDPRIPDPRIPAIGPCLKFGFRPDVETARDVRAWRLVRERLSHPALQDI